MSEKQLRSLTRRQLQTLAKKENIRPANATSEKLIKRLLAKFFGSPRSFPHSLAVLVPSSAVSAIQDMALEVDLHVPEIPLAPQFSQDYEMQEDRVPAFQAAQWPHESIADDPCFPASNDYPSWGFAQPMAGPSTRPTIDDLRSQLEELNQSSPALALAAMERLVPAVRQASDDAASALRDIAWQGYYVERDLLSPLKTTPTLWDGTHVMPPGPRRTKWAAFLGEVNSEYAQMAAGAGPKNDSDASSVSASSISSNSAEWRQTATTVLDASRFLKQQNSSTDSSLSVD
ncbi:hypothetical protein C8F01DRAFT_1361964 [Mycena amicta]|nr:hypothetical protein C8F01DRAFT_1361964 [Mycena amicta]